MVLEFVAPGLESYLQRCNGCNAVLDYGANTRFDKKLLAHICTACGQMVN